MKLLSAALLLASIASVRSANTLRIILSQGVRIIDPTGTAALLEAPDSIDLVIDGKFTPFERKVKTVGDSGWKDFLCKYSPVEGKELSPGQTVTVGHYVIANLGLLTSEDSGHVTHECKLAT